MMATSRSRLASPGAGTDSSRGVRDAKAKVPPLSPSRPTYSRMREETGKVKE